MLLQGLFLCIWVFLDPYLSSFLTVLFSFFNFGFFYNLLNEINFTAHNLLRLNSIGFFLLEPAPLFSGNRVFSRNLPVENIPFSKRVHHIIGIKFFTEESFIIVFEDALYSWMIYFFAEPFTISLLWFYGRLIRFNI